MHSYFNCIIKNEKEETEASISTCKHWLGDRACPKGERAATGRLWECRRACLYFVSGLRSATEPDCGPVYSRGHQGSCPQRNYPFNRHPYFHLSVFTPRPNTAKGWPFVTLIFFLCTFFPQVKPSEEALFSLPSFFLPSRKKTTEQKVAGVLPQTSGICCSWRSDCSTRKVKKQPLKSIIDKDSEGAACVKTF